MRKLVNNSVTNTTTEIRLLDGSFTRSIVEYICNSNYYLDDETKKEFKCEYGAEWSPNSFPVCLKGCLLV